MKACVAGATGRTGRRLVQALVARGIPVRAMVRNRAKAVEYFPENVEIVTGDVLKPYTLESALGDSTVLVCATGAEPSFDVTGPYKVDYLGTGNLVKAAQARGIEHMVFVSSLCVSKLLHPLNLFWLVLYWKKKAEENLIASGLPYTIVRPGGLKETDTAELGTAGGVVVQPSDTLFEGSIPRVDVAAVCVESLFTPAARQKILEIVARPEAPPQSLAQLLTLID